MEARISGFLIEFDAKKTQQDGQRLISELESFIYGEITRKAEEILKRKKYLIPNLADTIFGFGKKNGIEPETIHFKITAIRK